MSAALSCGAAAIACGALLQAAVARQIPEEKRFSTDPKPQFTAFLYAPKVPETGRSAGSPVIFYSGEWGWRPLQQDTASYLASTGRFVLGLDAAEYFSTAIPADALAADFAKFRSFVNERAGRPKEAGVILVGFASGAEIIPYLVNRVGPSGVRGAVLIAPDKKGAMVFRVSIQLKLNSPPDEEFDVEKELKRMPPLPVALMEGSLDKESAAKALAESPRGPRKYAPVVGGDRQFHEVRDAFFTVLADALHWIDETAIPPRPGVAAPPAPVPATPEAAPPAVP